MVGSFAQLQCGASGRPLPSVTWLKNKVAFIPGNNTSITETVSDQKSKIISYLSFSPLSIGDNGEYSCFFQGSTRNQTAVRNISRSKELIIILNMLC